MPVVKKPFEEWNKPEASTLHIPQSAWIWEMPNGSSISNLPNIDFDWIYKNEPIAPIITEIYILIADEQHDILTTPHNIQLHKYLN